jgi:hypothetical protein
MAKASITEQYDDNSSITFMAETDSDLMDGHDGMGDVIQAVISLYLAASRTSGTDGDTDAEDG